MKPLNSRARRTAGWRETICRAGYQSGLCCRSFGLADPGWIYYDKNSGKFFASHIIGDSILADIFISYTRDDRALAEDLARALKRRNYTVWWDSELQAGENFNEKILTELTQAKATIVLWTPRSIKSLYVIDEARYALHKKKLVAAKSPEIDIHSIPFGFQSQHTVDVSDQEAILGAVQKLAGQPQAADAAGALDWEAVSQSEDPDVLMHFIEHATASADKRKAAEKLLHMNREGGQPASERSGQGDAKQAAGAPGAGSSAEVAKLSISNSTAFLRGLFFNIPKFSFSSQSKYGAAGTLVSSISVTFFVVYLVFNYVHRSYQMREYLLSYIYDLFGKMKMSFIIDILFKSPWDLNVSVFILTLLLLLVMNGRAFNKLFLMKSFAGGWGVGMVFVLIATVAAVFAITEGGFVNFGNRGLELLAITGFAALGGGAALAYVLKQYRRQR